MIKKSQLLLNLGLIALGSFSMGHAQLLLDDSFDDGGRTDGADALDTDWYHLRTGITLSNPSNTLQLAPTSSFRVAVGSFADTTLSVGQTLRFSFSMQYPNSQSSNDTGLRFGIHYDGGTAVTSDGSGTTPNPTIFDDAGYFFRAPTVGPAAVNAFEEFGNGTSNLFTGGDDNTELTNSSTNQVSGIASSFHDYVVDLTLVSASQLDISVTFDGVTVVSTSNIAAPTTTFNQVGFGYGSLNGSNNNLRLDNIQVAIIPEPSTYALIAGAALSVFVLATRRRRK